MQLNLVFVELNPWASWQENKASGYICSLNVTCSEDYLLEAWGQTIYWAD